MTNAKRDADALQHTLTMKYNEVAHRAADLEDQGLSTLALRQKSDAAMVNALKVSFMTQTPFYAYAREVQQAMNDFDIYLFESAEIIKQAQPPTLRQKAVAFLQGFRLSRATPVSSATGLQKVHHDV